MNSLAAMEVCCVRYKTTGDIARDFGVSASTIRHWADQFQHTLSPNTTPTANGFRVFDPVDVAKLRQIKRLRDDHLSLDEIRKIIDSHTFSVEFWATRVEELERELAGLRRDLERQESHYVGEITVRRPQGGRRAPAGKLAGQIITKRHLAADADELAASD